MRLLMRAACVASLLFLGAACSERVDAKVEKVPVGAEVQVTKEDGGLVQGTLKARDTESVKVDVGPVTRTVPRDQIADVNVVDESKPAPPPPPAAKFRELTVPAGTALAARLDSSVSSASSRPEDPVEATLVEDVTIGDTEVLPQGSKLRGEVVSAEPSGKVKGRASLALRFNSITTPSGDRYAIAAQFARRAESTRKQDAQKIGIPAAGGAVIGAIIGGKKGAAIGAAVGGGAGTAAVLTTSGKEISLPTGTTLSVPLAEPVDVRVPIR